MQIAQLEPNAIAEMRFRDVMNLRCANGVDSTENCSGNYDYVDTQANVLS